MPSKDELLTCPNCKSKPRITGTNASGPVKIRCSNKNCELSRESVGVIFWQGIKRNFSEDQAIQAFEQFQLSIEPLRKIIKRQSPVISAVVDRYNKGPYWQTQVISRFSVEIRPLILAIREYMRDE